MCKNNEKGIRPSPQKEALISLFLYFSLWVKPALPPNIDIAAIYSDLLVSLVFYRYSNYLTSNTCICMEMFIYLFQNKQI